MTRRDIQILVERLLWLVDKDYRLAKKLDTDTLFSYINIGIEKFTKTRVFGTNPKQKSFEQDLKRIDDLRTLVTSVELNVTKSTDYDNAYYVELPQDYLFTVGEDAYITSTDKCWKVINGKPEMKMVDIIEATLENITSKLNNSLSDHRLHNNTARPLRLILDNRIILFTDGNYSVERIRLTYIRRPLHIDEKLKLTNSKYEIIPIEISDLLEEYTELPEHTLQEIINLTVQYILANTGNPIINSFSSEVNNME